MATGNFSTKPGELDVGVCVDEKRCNDATNTLDFSPRVMGEHLTGHTNFDDTMLFIDDDCAIDDVFFIASDDAIRVEDRDAHLLQKGSFSQS